MKKADKRRSPLEVVPEQEPDDSGGVTPSGNRVESLELGLSRNALVALLQFCAIWQDIWIDDIPDGEIMISNEKQSPYVPATVDTLLEKSKRLASSYLSLMEEYQTRSTDSELRSTRNASGSSDINGCFPMPLKSYLAASQQASQISPPTGQHGFEEGFGTSLLSCINLQKALRIFALITPQLQVVFLIDDFPTYFI